MPTHQVVTPAKSLHVQACPQRIQRGIIAKSPSSACMHQQRLTACTPSAGIVGLFSQKNSPNASFFALLLLCIFYIHQMTLFNSLFYYTFFIRHEIPSFYKNITHLLFLSLYARFHYFYTLHFLFS